MPSMRRMVNGSIFQLVGVNRYDVPAFTHDVSSMPPLHHANTATYGEHDTIQSKYSPAQGCCLERSALPDLRHSTDDALVTPWAHLDTQIYESEAYRNAPFRARQHELITGYGNQGWNIFHGSWKNLHKERRTTEGYARGLDYGRPAPQSKQCRDVTLQRGCKDMTITGYGNRGRHNSFNRYHMKRNLPTPACRLAGSGSFQGYRFNRRNTDM